MKKVLLLMAASIMAVSANAQFASKRTGAKAQAQVRTLPQATFQQKMQLVSERPNVGKMVLAGKNVGKKLTITESMKKSVVAAACQKKNLKVSSRAATVSSEYIATGFVTDDADASKWTMLSGTSDDGSALLLADVIPNCFGFEEGVIVEYTLEGNTIVIQPQLVASLPDKGYYMFLDDYNAEDGVIKLEVADDGTITSTNMTLEYGVFTSETFDLNNYLGYWELVKNVKYRLPSAPASAPVVLCEPENTTLFAGLGVTGYSYNSNLALISAYAPFSLHNSTQDFADAWQWNAEEKISDDVINSIASTTRSLQFETVNAVYQNFSLVGSNEGVASEPYTWGYGHNVKDDGTLRYEDFYAYAGGMGDDFEFSDGSLATMTRQDPDGDLTFYLNWATPDLIEKYGSTSPSMTKIYSYQGKPSSAIYFEGVILPFVEFSANSDFNLHISIYKCHRSDSGSLTIGDLIAKSDATNDNVIADYAATSGLTSVEFNEFYIEDEMGMSESLDYLMIDDEFVIVIEGWDNGTFSGVLGSQGVDVSAISSTYFARTGKPDELRRYTSWFPALFIGLKSPVLGYFHTEDLTDILLPDVGGEATIHVKPMLYSRDHDTGESVTRIWMDDSSEDIPDWLSVEYTNPASTEDISFDLVFKADALPAGVDGRGANLVFAQEGALLKVTVAQGNYTGINTTVTTVKTKVTPAYNLAGQRVNANYKGIIVKDGKKYMNK